MKETLAVATLQDLHHTYRRTGQTPSQVLLAEWMPEDRGRMFRAVVEPDGDILVEAFHTTSVDILAPATYKQDTAPRWVLDRIAALSITPIPPPTQPIEDVGMRINDNIFWIVAPKET